MVFESGLPIYGVDEITLYSDLLCCALTMRDGIRRRRISVSWRLSASHPRTRERFLALYEITQESCATRVAAQARRHPVMEWLHLYNTRGPEVTSAPAPPLPGDRLVRRSVLLNAPPQPRP